MKQEFWTCVQKPVSKKIYKIKKVFFFSFISHNSDFFPDNSFFSPQKHEIVRKSHNSEFISLNSDIFFSELQEKNWNCEIKSHNYFFFNPMLETGFHRFYFWKCMQISAFLITLLHLHFRKLVIQNVMS